MSKERTPQPNTLDKKIEKKPSVTETPEQTSSKKAPEKTKPGANKSNRNPSRGGSQFRYNGSGRR